MTESDFFFLLCLSFLFGVFVNSIFLWNFFILYPACLRLLGGMLAVGSIFFKKQIWRILIVAVFFGGMFCFQTGFIAASDNALSRFNGDNSKSKVIGVIDQEPDGKNGQTVFTVKAASIERGGAISAIRKGKILVYAPDDNFNYGDLLELKGIMQEPPSFKDFDYKMFLAKDGVYSQMRNPEIMKIGVNRGNGPYASVLFVKEKLRSVINGNFRGDAAGFLRAYILGDKNSLSEQLTQELKITGLSHVVAISGAHIVLIEQIIFSLLLALGLWRRHALFSSLAFINLFLILSGFQISAVRATIMGSLYIIAKILGKKADAFRVLIFSAAAMAAGNPLILRYDVSFQLSFLAVLGMIFFMPSLSQWLKFVPEIKIFPVRDILAMTLSAQIFTLPVVAYNFGAVSLISPITNILIDPCVSLLMFFGMFCVIFGAFAQALGIIFSLPCQALLAYILLITKYFSKIPFASIACRPGVIIVLAYYICVFVAVFYNRKRIEFF